MAWKRGRRQPGTMMRRRNGRPASPPPPRPPSLEREDSARTRQLIEIMSVSAEVARSAMAATGHNVQTAIDHIIAHPELQAAMDRAAVAVTAAAEEEDATPVPPALQRQRSADLRELVAMGFTATEASEALEISAEEYAVPGVQCEDLRLGLPLHSLRASI